LVVGFVADRVALRAEVFARELWILVEKRLNPIVVLSQQRSDLFPLGRREFQVLCEMIEFPIESTVGRGSPGVLDSAPAVAAPVPVPWRCQSPRPPACQLFRR
jgi:hypothetical protein